MELGLIFLRSFLFYLTSFFNFCIQLFSFTVYGAFMSHEHLFAIMFLIIATVIAIIIVYVKEKLGKKEESKAM